MMSVNGFPAEPQGGEMLQRSRERGRLGHAYLCSGHNIQALEPLARTLAKTLNCLNPVKKAGSRIDCCDLCLACNNIEHGNHGDVHWVRPESKSRIITVDQMRELMKGIQLKANDSEHRSGIVVG